MGSMFLELFYNQLKLLDRVKFSQLISRASKSRFVRSSKFTLTREKPLTFFCPNHLQHLYTVFSKVIANITTKVVVLHTIAHLKVQQTLQYHNSVVWVATNWEYVISTSSQTSILAQHQPFARRAHKAQPGSVMNFYKASTRPPEIMRQDEVLIIKELDSLMPKGLEEELWHRLCAARYLLLWLLLHVWSNFENVINVRLSCWHLLVLRFTEYACVRFTVSFRLFIELLCSWQLCIRSWQGITPQFHLELLSD